MRSGSYKPSRGRTTLCCAFGWVCTPARRRSANGNYFGSAVNRAARVASAGHGGQILLSRVTVEVLGPQDGIDYVDLGSHRLKGLSEATHLFGVRADGMSWVDLPPVTVGSVSGNVPRTLTEFIGSTADLQARADDVSRGPLVTLIGPGGMERRAPRWRLVRPPTPPIRMARGS